MQRASKGVWSKTKVQFQVAFASYGQVIGVVLAGISLFNLVSHFFSLDLSSFFGYFFTLYRDFFRNMIDGILFFLPFQLPGEVKDLLTLYGLLGAVVVKSVRQLYPATEWAPLRFRSLRWRFLRWRLRAVLFYARDLLLWPRSVKKLYERPYVYWDDEPANDHYQSPIRLPDPKAEAFFMYDVRVIFCIQLSAMIATTLVTVALNSV
jgi:hypothetical protein